MTNTSSNPSARLPRRRFYLLRLWSDEPGTSWRASLQGVSNGEWRHFPDLESLHAFLKISGGDDNYEPDPGRDR